MSTKLKIRTPEGVKEVGLSDVRPYWLYDTLSISNGDTEGYFFRTPENKTLVDTNLKQFSTIQVGWTFEVSAIRVVPRVAISLASAEIIFNNSVVSFLREGDIEIFSIPTVMLNAGCGLTGAVYGHASAVDIVSLGVPSASSVLKQPIRFLLYGGETFNFRIQFNPAISGLAAAARIYLVLDGILKRGVRGA